VSEDLGNSAISTFLLTSGNVILWIKISILCDVALPGATIILHLEALEPKKMGDATEVTPPTEEKD
jgi:hypothetical protein